jgi:LmbE family N-acetylglucosaminyl deacetylase
MKTLIRNTINFLALPFEIMYLKRNLRDLKSKPSKLSELKFLPKNVMILAPHSDDEMLGAGGVIHSESFETVFHIYIPTLNEKGSDITRIKESKKAFSSVENKVVFYFGGLKDGKLLDQRNEIREQIIRIINEFKIKTVFVPFFTELHKDHAACSITALELLKENIVEEIYFFSTNHLFLPEMTNCFHPFPGNKFDKLRLLNNYESQKKINFRKMIEVEKTYSNILVGKYFSELFFRIDDSNKEIDRLISVSISVNKNNSERCGSISKILGILRFFDRNIRIIKQITS